MTHYLLQINSRENFILYCSLFDWYNGFIFDPKSLKETEKGFQYETAVVFDDYHRLRIEIEDSKPSIKVLNGLYEVDEECPVSVYQSLDFTVERVYEFYLRQKFIFEDMDEIKRKFDYVHSKYEEVVNRLTYEDALKFLETGQKAVTELKQLLPFAKGVAKEMINKYCIDILEKSSAINTIILTNAVKLHDAEVPI